MKNRIEFKPDEDIVIHSVVLVEQNERGIKGKGEYRRIPVIRNLYMNKYEFKMLKALADKYGVSMQAMIRMMTCRSYLEASLDECPDLFDLFAEAGDQEKTKAVEEKQTPADEDPFVLFDLDEDELGNAIDGFCFKEGVSETDKIQATLESLLKAMKKKSDAFVMAQSIARRIECRARSILRDANKHADELKKVLEVSVLSGEHMDVVEDEIVKSLRPLVVEVLALADDEKEINGAYEHLNEEERKELMTGISGLRQSGRDIMSAAHLLIRSCSDLDDTYEGFAGFIDREDEVLVACKKALEEIADVLEMVKRDLPDTIKDLRRLLSE